MLDRDGFRPNVGIILLNQKNQVFWGKRIRTHSWQFPQGGIDRGETPEQAMVRELHEEVGLHREHIRILARTRDWLRYEVPDRYIRRDARGHYKGQKQIWFLLQLMGNDWDLNLRATDHPEFDAWRWNDYWVPLDAVVEFKRGAARQVQRQQQIGQHGRRAFEIAPGVEQRVVGLDGNAVQRTRKGGLQGREKVGVVGKSGVILGLHVGIFKMQVFFFPERPVCLPCVRRCSRRRNCRPLRCALLFVHRMHRRLALCSTAPAGSAC